MYIKSPKRVGGCYAAAVTESGERTRCFFPGAVVCDVDDVFVRFVLGSVPEESALGISSVVSDCFAAGPAWCSENGIESPSEFVSPMTVVSEGVAFLKARVPRDGHAFRVGDRCDVTVCVRDIKLSGGRMVVNWRVDSYRDTGEEAPGACPREAPADAETRADAEADAEAEAGGVPGGDEEARGDPSDAEDLGEEDATCTPDEEGIAVSTDDVFESGLRTVRETLDLLQSQMDAVEKAARRGVCA